MEFWFAVPGGGARVDVHIVGNLNIPLYPEGHIACQTPIALFYIDRFGDQNFVQKIIEECMIVYPATANCSFFRLNEPQAVHLAHLLSQNPQDLPGADQSLVVLDGRLMQRRLFVNENRLALGAVVRQIYRDRGIDLEIVDTQLVIDDEGLAQRQIEARYSDWFSNELGDLATINNGGKTPRVITRIFERLKAAFRKPR